MYCRLRAEISSTVRPSFLLDNACTWLFVDGIESQVAQRSALKWSNRSADSGRRRPPRLFQFAQRLRKMSIVSNVRNVRIAPPTFRPSTVDLQALLRVVRGWRFRRLKVGWPSRYQRFWRSKPFVQCLHCLQCLQCSEKRFRNLYANWNIDIKITEILQTTHTIENLGYHTD